MWDLKASPDIRYGASAFRGFRAKATPCVESVVLHEAHERQVGEAMEILDQGPEDFYKVPY